jgi:glutathione S-transferase
MVKRNRRHTIIPHTTVHPASLNLQINMTPQLELYVLSWGIYPRRVLLYLSEKGLETSPAIKITSVSPTDISMEAPGKPPGSVPMLRLPDGTFIKQSVAILEYLEDLCDNPDPAQDWQLQLAKSAINKTSMRGETSKEKARTREILALADEASSQFCFAGHKGTVLFVPIEQTNALTAKLALEFCKKNLKLLEENYFAEDSRLGDGGKLTIAHCVLYALLQFSREVYGVDLLSEPELPALRSFYEAFKKRDVAKNGELQYPKEIIKLASQWLPLE